MNIKIIKADYHDPGHAKDIEYLLSFYASDIMGGGTALNERILKNVPLELSKRPYAFSVIAYIEGKAAGLINCFEAFSTFRCKPLVNIHDVIVNEFNCALDILLHGTQGYCQIRNSRIMLES